MRAGGYTLIELLVALTVLAIAAGAVALSLPSGEERRVRVEAARLGALFRIAQDQARMEGRALVWEADDQGYRFAPLDAEAARDWHDELLRPRSWPFAVRRLEAQRIVFGREPLLAPATVRIATTEREVLLALDALGNLAMQDCGSERCAASR